MKHRIPALLLSLAASSPGAYAQQAGELNETQLLGREVFAQSCGVCHLQPSLGVKTYAPMLNKASGAGNDEVTRSLGIRLAGSHGWPSVCATRFAVVSNEVVFRSLNASPATANRLFLIW